MAKNETEWTVRWTEVTNKFVGAPSDTKLASYRPFILSAALVVLISVGAWSQTELATVSGTITDASGAVVPGVGVTIVNQDTGLKRSSLTDGVGEYRFAGLPTGNYSLCLEKTGFQSQTREGVELTSAADVMIDSRLAIGNIQQQMTVIANVAGIDDTTSTINGLLLEKSLTELPLDNRDLFSAVALVPGVAPNPSSAPSLLSNGKAGQVSISGIRPNMTTVLIDGMDATDPVWGYSPAGASGFFLGLNELTEVHVLTQTFNAEYGGHGGAVIEMITKSGTNQFHGSLWELHRDASLDAKNYFDLGTSPIPPFVRNQFGAGIGGPLKRDQAFFFVNYEGFREIQASTAIATVPDALAHRGLLPSANNPAACTNATPSGCVATPINALMPQFLNLLPPSNGPDNGDGTGELITANKGTIREDHGMIHIDHNFSSTHSLFARYTVDDSSSQVPYIGTPPGTYVPGFPAFHLARNQYVTVQDRKTFGPELINELRFGVNRTTASTSIDNTHPGLSISLLPDRPFGMIDITGMSLIGNSPEFPLGDFSTVYQVQDQMSRAIGRHTLKFGVEFRRLQYNGPLDFAVNGLYSFQDLTPFGLQGSSNNPALEFFLQGLPLSYVGVNPSNADSDRGYRETFASGFAQDFVRVNSRLTVNVGLRYDFYSNPTEAFGRLSAFPNPATDSAPTVGKVFSGTPLDLLSPQAGFAWNVFGDGKTVVRSGFGIYRDQLPAALFGVDRLLPPFFGLEEFVLPQFLNTQNALLTQPLDAFATTYYPKFPYALDYNLNVERELAQGMILSAGYFGTRGNHLTREAEANPFEPALGHRYNPNLASPLLADLTDAQSFYNSFQVSVSKRHAGNLFWQASYTLAHSVDDASVDFDIESVNDPPASQNIFDRKGSRGRSDFDVRHNFVANVVYGLPGGGRLLGGWQVSAVASVHSGLPFTPVLAFDNADLQSLLITERPDLVGNPYAGVCPNGARVGTPSCWFNPSAFAVPPAGQFGKAGRNSLRGPGVRAI
ncbi:TonB-dependent receptor [Alloacidobacterium dinghuense]|uniref:TonB-dependent receptor n=1 Tax=Alloacidobacterium dinghuense TaxID=2763107 RepID=A0A7G8BD69_9BACT|nr:carboxypeptidase-like regulatory domain-containing protein [Alloacidobacterium dinghuense]QNI30489.1 TonB-dependent receptor [Alloacidobacterium dinghuense]